MLAAQCVCTVLRTEHSVIRESLSAVVDVLRLGRWRQPGAQQTRLRKVLDFLSRFEQLRHRPKDERLIAALRGRCAETDAWLDRIGLARQDYLGVLERGRALLATVEAGNGAAAAQLVGLLYGLQATLLTQLQVEEDELLVRASRLLDADDWSGLASEISCLAYPPDLAGVLPPAETDEQDSAVLASRADTGGEPVRRLVPVLLPVPAARAPWPAPVNHGRFPVGTAGLAG